MERRKKIKDDPYDLDVESDTEETLTVNQRVKVCIQIICTLKP